MTEPWMFSATQLRNFELCPRKWAWRYIDGEPEKETKAKSFGKEVHKQLELWLRDGKSPDLNTRAGKVAYAGLRLLPPPKTPGMLLEQGMGVDIGGFYFGGLVDVQVISNNIPTVIDHKTTADFEFITIDLAKDYQACLYAADAMVRTEKPECDVRFVYYKTKGRAEAKEVHLNLTWDTIEPTLERARTRAAQMQGILDSGKTAKDIPFNAGACYVFGECDFIEKCGINIRDRMRAKMQQQNVEQWLEQIKARGINPPEQTADDFIADVEEEPPIPVWNEKEKCWEMPVEAKSAPPPAPDTEPAPAPKKTKPKSKKQKELPFPQESSEPAKAEVLPDPAWLFRSVLNQGVALGKACQELLARMPKER